MKKLMLHYLMVVMFLMVYQGLADDYSNIKNGQVIGQEKLKVLFPFSDDFESGLSNWLVSGQDWDTTSATFRSPGHSITDSPGGNYPPFSNATITLASAIDLSASVSPVLTLWHRYYVRSGSDFCYVEISEDYGFTWSQLTYFTGYTTTLHPIQIDLSNYKTSPILIRFRLRDNGDSYLYDGWYIDDVAIAEINSTNIPFPFFEDFESGFNNWLVSGQDWDTTNATFRSPGNSINDKPGGSYPSYSNATITLANSIDLSSSISPVLTFWHRYYVRSGSDFCYVEISEDYGFTWSQLTSFTGYFTTLHPIQIDLSNYKTSPILIRFRLRDNGDSYRYNGWYIDDISIAEINTTNTPFPFYEDFEGGFDNWLVSGQDWDTTSATFRSPGHSINDNPGGSYPSYSNATITLANSIDLSSSISPVLTFWHRYYVRSGSDFCYVEISEDNGFNWSQLNYFTGYTTTLHPMHIDLSNYKTSLILIRFRLRDNGDSYLYNGWYIDDISIAEKNTSSTPFPFFEDFEGGFSNWLVSGQDWDTTNYTFRSPSHSINDNPGGNYPSYSNATITLANPIDLTSSNVPVLTFWHQYYVRSGHDFCNVEISEDDGFNWSLLTNYTGYTTTLFPSQIDLSNYKTTPILIRFRLRDNGDSYVYSGWYIDDVEIRDLNPNILDDIINNIPKECSLQQNYPNPFNPSTNIRFGLPKASRVKIEVYNMLGQKVAELLNEHKQAGYHSVEFDGSNFSSGVYFYKIQTSEFQQVRKMLLVK